VLGGDGAGVYCTDLNPLRNPRRLISNKCWDEWRPQTMEAFISIPEKLTEYCGRRTFRIPGTNPIPITWTPVAAHWDGSDPFDPFAPGRWVPRKLNCPL